jgi:hypothetical protein
VGLPDVGVAPQLTDGAAGVDTTATRAPLEFVVEAGGVVLGQL